MIRNKVSRSNSKLAQFKAAVAHLPFTEFNETSDSIVASYETKPTKTNPVAISVVVTYSSKYKGTSCNFTIYRNDVQIDHYGTYDINEFVEQLEPYFNLGNEGSLIKQLDRRLTQLETLVNGDNDLNKLQQQELDCDNEIECLFSLMLQEKYERGFIDGAKCYSDIDSKSDYWDDNTTKGKLMGGIGVVGISRLKDLELDAISKIGDVKPKSSRLVKRKLIM
jgi:hypothetical protein